MGTRFIGGGDGGGSVAGGSGGGCDVGFARACGKGKYVSTWVGVTCIFAPKKFSGLRARALSTRAFCDSFLAQYATFSSVV